MMKIDHVTVAASDMAALVKAFAAAGIEAESGGKHTNGMTEMAIASFPDGSYLELIAGQPGANVAGHDWGRFIRQNAGVCAWAVTIENLETEARRLKAAGILISPVAGGRVRPDGVQLRWRTAPVGPAPHGSYFPFLIQDATERSLRVYPHGRASVPAMRGVSFIVIAVRDLDGAVLRWHAAFGFPTPELQEDPELRARLAWFPGTPVILASAAQPGTPVSERIDRFGEAPFATVLRAQTPPQTAGNNRSDWFGHKIQWLDPAAIMGARVGVE